MNNPAQAKTCQKISRLYNRYIKGEYYFTAAQITALDEALVSWQIIKINGLQNLPNEYFFYLLSHAPTAVINFFKLAPTSEKAVHAYLKEANQRLAYDDFPTLFFTLKETFIRKKNESSIGNSREFIIAGLQSIKDLPDSAIDTLRLNLKKDFEDALTLQKITFHYYKQLYVEIIQHNKFLKIAEHVYPYRSEEGIHYVQVSRSRIRHPAWNPIKTKKIIKILEKKINPPDTYYAKIGLDGLFYIEDGNHRFHSMENKEFVWLQIPPQLRTMNLPQYYYFLFGKRYTSQEIQNIVDGNLDPFFYLNPTQRKRIIFNLDELESDHNRAPLTSDWDL